MVYWRTGCYVPPQLSRILSEGLPADSFAPLHSKTTQPVIRNKQRKEDENLRLYSLQSSQRHGENVATCDSKNEGGAAVCKRQTNTETCRQSAGQLEGSHQEKQVPSNSHAPKQLVCVCVCVCMPVLTQCMHVCVCLSNSAFTIQTLLTSLSVSHTSSLGNQTLKA